MYDTQDDKVDAVGPQQASNSQKSRVEQFKFDIPTSITTYIYLFEEHTPPAKQKEQMIKNASKKDIQRNSTKVFNHISSKEIMATWGK